MAFQQKRINTIFRDVREKIKQQHKSISERFNSDEEFAQKLRDANKGIECFVNFRRMLDLDANSTASDLEYKRSTLIMGTSGESFPKTRVTVQCGLIDFDQCDENTLVFLYAPYIPSDGPPSADVRGLIAGGIPSYFTHLAEKTTLAWHINSPTLSTFDLHAQTLFYLPTVIRTSDMTSFSVGIGADVKCVNDYKLEEEDRDVNMPSIIRTKMQMAMHLALRDHKRRVVLGDMNVPHQEHRDFNTMFATCAKQVVEEFDGCFEEIVINVSSPMTYFAVRATGL